MDVHHIQAIEQIRSKSTGGHLLFQNAIGCRHHSDVDLERLAASNSFKLHFLQDPEEFDLEGRGHFTDLIQKERSPVGKFEATFSLTNGAAERSPFVSEELAFEEGFRQCATVDRDERVFGSSAVEMDRPCDQLFSGTPIPL